MSIFATLPPVETETSSCGGMYKLIRPNLQEAQKGHSDLMLQAPAQNVSQSTNHNAVRTVNFNRQAPNLCRACSAVNLKLIGGTCKKMGTMRQSKTGVVTSMTSRLCDTAVVTSMRSQLYNTSCPSLLLSVHPSSHCKEMSLMRIRYGLKTQVSDKPLPLTGNL